MDKILNIVQPFNAQHYNAEKIENIGKCLSQPYDVIDSKQQKMYYNQHEYNIIRLILGKQFNNDNETNNRYTRSFEFFDRWRKEDILHSTKRKSFWIYEQEFELPGGGKRKVKGFIGKVRLRDYSEISILPHEKVLKNPIEDRIKLTTTCNTQFEYIWSVYRDKGFVIDNILLECEKDPTIIDYLEQPFNVRHKLWRLVDPEKCMQIQETMKNLKIYIADGHHRYETMRRIRDIYRKKYPDAGPDAPWEYILMFLVNSEHEGITILPYHRVIYNLDNINWEKVITDLGDYFYVNKYTFHNGNKQEIISKWLLDIKTEKPNEHKFGFYIGELNSLFLLKLKDIEVYKEMLDTDCSSDWKLLDVNIVNFLILKKIIGLSEENLSMSTNLKYSSDSKSAIEKVNSGEMQAAIILNPTRLKDVLKIANNKEIMPRKSTFFYPKPVSGLVMYNMDL